MAKSKERKEFTKQNYVSSFNVVGRAIVTDSTFSLDQKSNKSDWIYNRMNLGIDCGDDNGVVYVTSMGGYGADRANVIYVHGKNDDGSDDFKNSYTVNFEDRNEDAVLSSVGRMCLKSAAVERDNKGKNVYRNFLSEYDMIQYLADHLENGTVVGVSGNLEYQIYNGVTNVQRVVTRISLYDAEPSDFRANFTQTILLDENCKGEIDKTTGEMVIDGYVLEYMKEYRGHSLAVGDKKGQNVPLPFSFRYMINLENKELSQKAIKKLFDVKKGSVNVLTMEGHMMSSGATVQMTEDELPDDIKEFINLGIMSLEDALTSCATNGNRERKMIIVKPRIKNVTNQDGTVNHVVQIFEGEYSAEDLDYFRTMVDSTHTEDISDGMNPPEEEADEVEFGDVVGDDSSWLDDL